MRRLRHASSRPILTCTGPPTDFSRAGVSSNVQYAGRPARAACRDKSDVGQGHPRQRGNDACALYTSLSSGTEGRREDRARTLRTYIRFGAENTTPNNTGGGTTFNPFWDRAFIQFAGFTVGRSQSFFDLFTYGGAYSSHNVRVSGDTGASGQNLWAYTAQFGNGFSGTLSLEDPATRCRRGSGRN